MEAVRCPLSSRATSLMCQHCQAAKQPWIIGSLPTTTSTGLHQDLGDVKGLTAIGGGLLGTTRNASPRVPTRLPSDLETMRQTHAIKSVRLKMAVLYD